MAGIYSYEGLDEIKLLMRDFYHPDGPSNNDIIDKINEITKKVNILIDSEDSRINRRQ